MKQEAVMRLLADEVPRSLPQIRESTGLSKLDSVMADMFHRGKVLATEKLRAYMPAQRGNGDWYWKRSTFRFYTVPNGQPQVTRTCQYETFDRKLGKVITVSKDLLFTSKEGSNTTKKIWTGRLIEDLLAQSRTALFAHEIAASLKVPASKVRASLSYLEKQGRIRKAGWWNQRKGREMQFHRGYLYFLSEDQYRQRLKAKDLLEGLRRSTYEKILFNSRIQRRLTPHGELFPTKNQDRSWVIQEIQCLYPELKHVELNGRTYYYIEGELPDLEGQVKYFSRKASEQQSFHTLIGHGHEEYAQLALDSAFQRGDLKVEGYRWDFRIDRSGRKRFNVYHSRSSDPRRVHEFDRVLRADLAPFSGRGYMRTICFVFECRYVTDPSKEDWDQFLRKLADSYEFGTTMELPSADDARRTVRVRALKPTVIPVLILSWPGQKKIEVGGRKLSLAQYVNMHGAQRSILASWNATWSRQQAERCPSRSSSRNGTGSMKLKAAENSSSIYSNTVE